MLGGNIVRIRTLVYGFVHLRTYNYLRRGGISAQQEQGEENKIKKLSFVVFGAVAFSSLWPN